MQQSQQLLRLPEVCRTVGLSRSEIYRRMAMNPPQFPKSVAIGEAARAWVSDEVAAWVSARVAERDSQKQAA